MTQNKSPQPMENASCVVYREWGGFRWGFQHHSVWRMSVGPIPPAEGRALEVCHPVTCLLEWRTIWKPQRVCLHLYPTMFFVNFLSPFLGVRRKPSALPCTRGKSKCCFLESLEAFAGSYLSKCRVICSPTGKWRHGCLFSLARVLLQSESNVPRTFSLCTLLRCPHLHAGKGNWHWVTSPVITALQNELQDIE